jgi:glycosyltransferase involved in cell wall biosynthesis
VTEVTQLKIVSIVIPTLNEELAITDTLKSIPVAALNKMGYEVEVIVVDGMSKDSTRQRAVEAGAKVVIEPRKGYGIPIRTGVRNSCGEIIAKADGDWTYPLEKLPNFLVLLETKKLDVIFTDRLSTLNPETMSLRNRVGNKVLSWAVRSVFGLNLKDSQSGMWMIRRSAWDQLVLKRNLSFSQELKIEALRFAKLPSEQVQIAYRSRLGKASYGNWQTGIFLMIALVSLRLRRKHSRPIRHTASSP